MQNLTYGPSSVGASAVKKMKASSGKCVRYSVYEISDKPLAAKLYARFSQGVTASPVNKTAKLAPIINLCPNQCPPELAIRVAKNRPPTVARNMEFLKNCAPKPFATTA